MELKLFGLALYTDKNISVNLVVTYYDLWS